MESNLTNSLGKISSEGASVRHLRTAALIRKEVFQILRDPSSMLIAFALPLILLFIFGYGVSLDVSRTRIGVVIEQSSPDANSLVAGFEASGYFDVQVAHDRRQFDRELVDGVIKGIVVVPPRFAANRANPGSADLLQVIVDGSDPNTARFVQNYTQGVVATWFAVRTTETGRSAAAPITVQQRFWFNTELSSRNFLVPGSIAIVMTLVGTLLTALVVAREWERGTMEAMMATPVTAFQMMLGKVVPYFILALISMTLCVIIAVFLFGVPFRGSLLALYALAAAFLCPALGQGLLISAATKNQFLASQVALLSAFLPSFLLSGFLFEIDSMPRIIQGISALLPARYLITSLQTVFLTGDIWPLFLRDMGILLLQGAVLFLFTARAMRKGLE